MSHYKHHNAISRQFQPKHIQVLIESAGVTISNDVSDYVFSEFIDMQKRLNEAKSKLDIYYVTSKKDKSMEKTWLTFQNIIDTYKQMRFDIEKNYNAKHVTNAWMKYWEIYSQYNLVPTSARPSRPYLAFFNAELPGAALCAFNHFMKAMRPGVAFDWRASSLAPGEETKGALDALGDTYGLYAKNKEKWLMQLAGESNNECRNNGDVTIVANLLDFAAKIGPASDLGGVDFYSHDAGIDVSENFNIQEEANAKIHLGCAVAGFMTLRTGGTFIAKQYTFFETLTWNLILIYSQLFDSFYICKPLTSRPYNSEIYLVGLGFKGFDEDVKKVLLARLEDFNMRPLIPADATKILFSKSVSELHRFARIIFGQQISLINENVQLFEKYKNNLGALRHGLENVKAQKISEWMKIYPVKSIADADQLPSY